jgi:hypothetical protein
MILGVLAVVQNWQEDLGNGLKELNIGCKKWEELIQMTQNMRENYINQ